MDSSNDELDILKKQMEKQKQASMPQNLKMFPMIHSKQPSRSSSRINSSEHSGVNTVDKYFTDMNGNSLLSTLNSSKDYFSSISGRSSSRRRSTLINGTGIGINAGNRVVFGDSSLNAPILSRGINSILNSRESPYSHRDGKH
jgi:hypothetical protein